MFYTILVHNNWLFYANMYAIRQPISLISIFMIDLVNTWWECKVTRFFTIKQVFYTTSFSNTEKQTNKYVLFDSYQFLLRHFSLFIIYTFNGILRG